MMVRDYARALCVADFITLGAFTTLNLMPLIEATSFRTFMMATGTCVIVDWVTWPFQYEVCTYARDAICDSLVRVLKFIVSVYDKIY